MKMGKKGANWSKLWRRNAVVAAVALFVCAAVYLNWSYEQEAQAGKMLGQSTMVGAGAKDPLIEKKSGEKPKEEKKDLKNPPAPGGTEKKEGGYFASARLNRKQARDSALSLLQDAAAKEDADAAVKKQVNATIQTMADSTVTEAQIENLVLAKG